MHKRRAILSEAEGRSLDLAAEGMNYFWVSVGGVFASGIISSIAYVYVRLRSLEAALLKSQEEVKDAKITKNAHALSEPELNALVGEFIGPGKPGAPPKT